MLVQVRQHHTVAFARASCGSSKYWVDGNPCWSGMTGSCLPTLQMFPMPEGLAARSLTLKITVQLGLQLSMLTDCAIATFMIRT